MLINESKVTAVDPILAIVAAMNNKPYVKQLQQGVYLIGHFGGSHFLQGYNHYPEVLVGFYGVCDNLEQLLSACPELESSDRKFVITLTSICKSDQPEDGGWRWHKWGEYIGIQNPKCEYLYDEPEIEEVFCYQIYEKI